MSARASPLFTLAGFSICAFGLFILTGEVFFTVLALLGALICTVIFITWMLRGPHHNPFDPD